MLSTPVLARTHFLRRALASIYRRIAPQVLQRHILAYRLERRRRRFAFKKQPSWQIPENTHAPVEKLPAKLNVGVNVIGHLSAQFGLGESARNYARAFERAGIQVALFDLPLDLPHVTVESSSNTAFDQALKYPVSVMFINPDYMGKALEFLGPKRNELGYLIGCWFWELERLPKSWADSLQYLDEVMVATSFVERAIKADTEKPVTRIPVPLADLQDSGLNRNDFGLDPEAFIFLFSFDFASWIERKNPMAVVRAFKEAFQDPCQKVQLILKSTNGHRLNGWLQQLETEVGNDPRILIRDDAIHRAHMTALQRCCNVFVSLHRSEGFGMGIAECMSQGKPVIATGWSGNLDFMDDDCSALVKYSLVEVRPGEYQDAAEGLHWADADISDAARWMQRLSRDTALADTFGKAGRERVRHLLNPATVGTHFLNRLIEIAESLDNGPENEISGCRPTESLQ